MAEFEKQCPRCAETVKAAAAVCRFCGFNFVSGKSPVQAARSAPPQPDRTPFFGRGIWTNIAAGLAIVFGLSFLTSQCKNATLPDGSMAPASTDIPPVNPDGTVAAAPVTIAELVAAYQANEMQAQQKFGSQWLVVSGKVSSIELDMTDEPVVHFAADIMPEPSARFAPEFQKQAGSLQKGQDVSLVCANVHEFMGSPGLESCQVMYDSMVQKKAQ